MMDAETLKTLGWILLWGGVIFVMVKYGCVAHLMGRHGAHHADDRAGGGAAKDPVCGMAVKESDAAGAAVHAGRTYYFCSRSCRDEFEQAPAQYASRIAAPQAVESHGGCCGSHAKKRDTRTATEHSA